MTTFLLIRHGQSEWNAEGRWQGQADPPLSELGVHQARAAADGVGMVDAIVSSDLERAAMTAAIIAEGIGVGPVLTDERLRERHAGPWQGLTRAQINEQYPGYLDNGQRPKGYESDEAVTERAIDALEEWRLAGDTVLVITHGGLIGALEKSLGAPWERFGNLDGRYFVLDEHGLRLGDRVALIDPDAITVPALE